MTHSTTTYTATTLICVQINPIHPGSNTQIEMKLFTGLRSVQMF